MDKGDVVAAISPSKHRIKETVTLRRPYSPVVVDIWEPDTPTPVDDLPVIMLVHGWGGTGSYWERTAKDLSAAARVIVPDLPGTGRSQPVRATRNMYDQVETLASVLDELDIERVQLVGHSMGGAMSVLLGAAQPGRIERMVLTSLTFFRTEQQEQIYETIMGIYRFSMPFRPNWLASIGGVRRALAMQYFHRVPDDEVVLEQGLRDYLNLDAGTALACARNATDEAIPEAGAQLQMPVLLVANRNDKMMPDGNVQYTVDIIPDCDVVWIEECGHLPMVEKPKEYSAILQGFLRVR
jgi:pimeloyl-ACP methyl ester carboxylesterase